MEPMVDKINQGKASAASLEAYLNQQIAERVEEVRDTQEQIGSLSERIETLKRELYELLEQKGSSWSDETGYARLVSEGLRRSYDNKALDQLILSDPLHYGWLKEYRRESTVRGGVQIK